MVKIAIDQAVEQVADIEPPLPACGVGVADNIDGAAIGQQVIEFRRVGKLVNPVQIDKNSRRTLSAEVLRRYKYTGSWR